MHRYSAVRGTALVLLSLVFAGAGCAAKPTPAAKTPTPPTEDSVASSPIAATTAKTTTEIFESRTLGVRLTLVAGRAAQIEERGDKFVGKAGTNYEGQYLQVLNKPAAQSMEDAILALVAEAGKDASKCKVVTDDGKAFVLDLVTPITKYTAAQQAEIDRAEAEKSPERGPVDGDFIKRKIYDQALIEACSTYADPNDLSLTETLPSGFIAYPDESKTTFIYMPAVSVQPFYRGGKIEFLK